MKLPKTVFSVATMVGKRTGRVERANVGLATHMEEFLSPADGSVTNSKV